MAGPLITSAGFLTGLLCTVSPVSPLLALDPEPSMAQQGEGHCNSVTTAGIQVTGHGAVRCLARSLQEAGNIPTRTPRSRLVS